MRRQCRIDSMSPSERTEFEDAAESSEDVEIDVDAPGVHARHDVGNRPFLAKVEQHRIVLIQIHIHFPS